VATTVTNTTFLFLCAILIACIVRYARRGENEAGTWIKDRVQLLSRSKLLIIVLVVGGAAGVATHVLVGYIGTGDLFQDFVGAKEFLAGRSMNPPSNMRERVDYWLGQQHMESSSLVRWAPLRRMQAGSIENMRSDTVIQGHPPFHILLIAPIVAVFGSIQGTYLAIAAVNVAAYAGLLLLLWRSTPLPALVPASAAALLCLLALDWQPLLANLRQGQIHPLVGFFVIAGWYFLSRDQPWPAGILIGLAALVKMFPGLLLFWLLLRRRRAFIAAVCTMFAAALFLYSIRGPQPFIDYYDTVRSYEAQFGSGRENYSLSSVITYVIAGPGAKSIWASAVVVLGDVLLLGYTAFLTLRKRKPTRIDTALEFSGFVVLACLMSPTVEAFYYPILLLPIATLAGVVRPQAVLRGSIALLGILWCFSSPEQVVWLPTQALTPMLGARLAFLLCSFPTFGMLALWYWIMRRQRTTAN